MPTRLLLATVCFLCAAAGSRAALSDSSLDPNSDLREHCTVLAPRALRSPDALLAAPSDADDGADDDDEDRVTYVSAGVDFHSPAHGATYEAGVAVPVGLAIDLVPPPRDAAAADALELCFALDRAPVPLCVALSAALFGGDGARLAPLQGVWAGGPGGRARRRSRRAPVVVVRAGQRRRRSARPQPIRLCTHQFLWATTAPRRERVVRA